MVRRRNAIGLEEAVSVRPAFQGRVPSNQCVRTAPINFATIINASLQMARAAELQFGPTKPNTALRKTDN